MRKLKSRRLSPATVISIVALVFAVAGTAVAGVATVSVLNKKEKKQTRNIASDEIKKAAPGLSVANAGQLGGKPSADYLLAHSRGVALAGAKIAGNGSVDTWFNTLGGAPTVSPSSYLYDITFPGLGDASQTVLQATLVNTNLGGQITADYGTPVPGQTAVEVLTFNAAGAGTPRAFYVVVYGASGSG
jgi:hypothetical protein